MAQAPSVDRPVRFPMVQDISVREGSQFQDARMYNAFGEKSADGEYWIYKRPGLNPLPQHLTGTGWGMYNWNGTIFLIAGTTVSIISSFPTISGLGTVGQDNSYRFEPCRGATPKLFFMNSSYAYTYSAGTGLVRVTDTDYPASLVQGCVYLDGTMYVMDVGGHIRGSDLNDTTSWDPVNVIVAQMEPDPGVALARHMSFVVALKGWSTEFFFDAGNPTGSPLQSNPSMKINFGCVSADTVQDIDGELYWLSANKSADFNVIRMANGTPQIISNKAINRKLSNLTPTSVSNLRSWTHKENGHRFYGLSSFSDNYTIVYDVDEGLWSFWVAGNTGNVFPIVANTFLTNTLALTQDVSNGNIYQMTKAVVNDSGQPIGVDIYTPNADMNTRRMKVLGSLEIIGDQIPGAKLYISCSDDDYQSWSLPRIVDISKPRPILYRCGSFHRRAYHIHHEDNTDLHLKALECQIDIGTL